MNLYHVFFYLTCFIALNNYSFLFAHDGDKSSKTQACVDRKITMLIDNICDLLLHGYSTDEVIKILADNQKHQYDTQKLVTLIHFLLNKKHSKNIILNILVNNENFKKFYAQKNFWTQVKNCYFVLKIIVILAIIIIVAYLLSHYFDLPGLFCSNSLSASDNKQEFNEDKSSSCKQPQAHDSDPECRSESSQPSENQEEQNLDVAMQVQQITQQPDQSTPIETEQKRYQQDMQPNSKQTNPFGLAPLLHIYDHELYMELKQQIEHAKRIGLEPSAIQFDGTEKNKAQRDNRKFKDLIAEQIEQAKELGLEPVET